MAVNTERTFAFAAASLASWEYHERAKNQTVARIAKTVTTTMSSASVNQENFFEAAARRILPTREETESESGTSAEFLKWRMFAWKTKYGVAHDATPYRTHIKCSND